MRELVLQVSAMSLDGCVTAEATEAERLIDVPDHARDEWLVSRLRTAGTHIMGRRTYESMAAYWPGSTEVFAEPMNTIPKVVFSRSLATADWTESRIAAGDTAAEVAALKKEPGGPVVAHGGIEFARSLATLGVVDEYRLCVHPYVAGVGERLFEGVAGPRGLELTEVARFPSGALGLVYRPR